MKRFVITLVTALACAQAAQAATINETDLIDGDFTDNKFDTIDTVSLMDGITTINGTATGTCEEVNVGFSGREIRCAGRGAPGRPDPGDFLAFDFVLGSTITQSINFMISNVVAPDGFVANFGVIAIDPASNAFLADPLTEGVTTVVTGAFPVGQVINTQIPFLFGSYGDRANAEGAYSYDWTMSIGVSVPTIPPAVPLPASGLMLLAALGAGITLRRRTG
ncbi:MAG: VPLPA-CTERM sorting domain-containing protein [Pseudomonadota bacterium]